MTLYKPPDNGCVRWSSTIYQICVRYTGLLATLRGILSSNNFTNGGPCNTHQWRYDFEIRSEFFLPASPRLRCIDWEMGSESRRGKNYSRIYSCSKHHMKNITITRIRESGWVHPRSVASHKPLQLENRSIEHNGKRETTALEPSKLVKRTRNCRSV